MAARYAAGEQVVDPGKKSALTAVGCNIPPGLVSGREGFGRNETT